MKFLVDNALSPAIADELIKLGFDAVHVRDKGIQHAKDEVIFQTAFDEERVILTADTDFSLLLSNWHHNKPSVITFRKGAESHPLKQVELLRLNLNEPVLEALEQGSIVIIEPSRIRIRKLPLH